MANVNRPGGLKPVAYLNGAPYTGQARLYYRGTGDGNAIYVGDPVTLGGSADANGIADVVIGVAGSAIVGVVVGVVVAAPSVSLVGSSIDLSDRHLAASTAGYLLVADDPNIVFEIQDGVVAGTQVTDIGQDVNFLIVAGTNNWGDSNTTTATTITNTQTANLKLLGFSQKPDNVPGTQYAKLLVKINNHVYGSYTGTASI